MGQARVRDAIRDNISKADEDRADQLASLNSQLVA
jgi:hypothetical protein